MTPEEKLAQMGLTLPPTPTPAGNYVPFKRDGTIAYLAGQGPRKADGSLHTGKVGADVTVETAYEHAKLVGLQILASAKAGGAATCPRSSSSRCSAWSMARRISATIRASSTASPTSWWRSRRPRPPRPLGGGHGLAAHGDHRGDRSGDPDPRLRGGGDRPTCSSTTQAPHPSSLPASGERGLRRRDRPQSSCQALTSSIETLRCCPSPRLRGEGRVRGFWKHRGWTRRSPPLSASWPGLSRPSTT